MKWFMLIFVFYSISFSQIYVPIFEDDFENNYASSWRLSGDLTIQKENGNSFLHSESTLQAKTSHSVSYLSFQYSMKFRITSGSLTLALRHSELNSEYQNYSLLINESSVTFAKKFYNQLETNITTVDNEISLDEWYDLRLTADRDHFKLTFNNETIIDTIDASSPLLTGQTYFYLSATESEISIDDVILKGILPNQNASWIRTGGPWGGYGHDICIDPADPDIMYVTDALSGNHKTINGGITWYQNNTGIDGAQTNSNQSVSIYSLTIDPNDNDRLWCGTADTAGVYLSTDAGETWTKKTNGFPDFEWGVSIMGISVQPGNSDVVFCGLEVGVNPIRIPPGKEGAVQGAIYKTIDGGENWYKILDSDALVRHILINPDNPEIMYASTGIVITDCMDEEGVWKSTDAGETWFHRNAGFTEITIGGMYMDDSDPETLWACTGREEAFGGDNSGDIYKTTNGGDAWEKLYEGERPITAITTSPVNPDVVLAVNEDNTFLSIDGGATWTVRTYNMKGLYSGIPIGIAAHPTYENTFFINSRSGGVFATFDQGETWQPFNNGYTGAEMFSLVIDPTDVNSVIATGRSGIAKTTNGGVNWNPAGHIENEVVGLMEGPLGEMMLMEANPLNINTLYTGADYSPQFMRTYDRFNWNSAYDFTNNPIEEGEGIGSIAVSATDTNIIFVAIRTTELPLVLDRTGQTFNPSTFSKGILKSTDGGASWNESNTGIEGTTKNVQVLSFDPVDNETIYASVYGFGVFKSTDAGEMWYYSGVGILPGEIACIEIDPVNNNNIYVGTEQGGLYKSTDAAITWEKKTTGITPEGTIKGIAIDPTNPENIYAGDLLSGVYKSTDAGETWTILNDGLNQTRVQDLKISSDGMVLYAATQGDGVYRLSYENQKPVLQYVYPSTSSTLYLGTEEDIEFTVNAIDFNNDALTYTWKFDNDELEEISSMLSVNTSTFPEGIHYLQCRISDGIFSEYVEWVLNIDPSTGNETEDLPREFSLSQNYPNPFNPSTTIKYAVPQNSYVILKIFNILGEAVKTLINEEINAGFHEVNWNASGYSSGVYFYRLSAVGVDGKSFTRVEKMLLLK